MRMTFDFLLRSFLAGSSPGPKRGALDAPIRELRAGRLNSSFLRCAITIAAGDLWSKDGTAVGLVSIASLQAMGETGFGWRTEGGRLRRG